MDDVRNPSNDGYEVPALTEYGSIEEWTKGQYAELINLSLVTP